MKYFINVSSFPSQNKEKLRKALYNLFNLKELSVLAEGMKTSMRRDCDHDYRKSKILAIKTMYFHKNYVKIIKINLFFTRRRKWERQ